MANSIIISEFEKLVSFVQNELDNSKDAKTKTANGFRLRQIKNALTIIKKYPKSISDNMEEFAEFPGIGKGTMERINEIITTSKLSETKNFKKNKDTMIQDKALEDLESVVGIGRAHALELIKEGITSVDMLKKAIDNKKIEVNDKIALGVKYYKVFEGNIPRAEITKIKNLLQKVITKLNKNLNENEQYIFEICGSYRREKQVSGDIDVLISKKNNEDVDTYLSKIVSILKLPIKANNDKPLIVDSMTDNYETKYMGFAQYKDSKVRRIDIRFVPYKSYYSALVYFTGSAELNKNMRKIAKAKNLKLSEYGLTQKDGTTLTINNEYDIFKILEMKYLPPNER